MAPACDRFYGAVVAGTMTHDGDPRLTRHVLNARARETRHGRVITKDHRDSPRRIDAAVAAVVAFERAQVEEAPPMVWAYDTKRAIEFV